MTRSCGWAAKGQRLTAHVPHGHWKTLTFLASLRHDSIVAPFVLDGPINGEMFTAWVGQCLVPTLTPGDIIIADNLGSHKGMPARQLIRNAGAHLLFRFRGKPSTGRPSSSSNPHSPYLNPIEMVFAKLKTLFRKADERTIEASWRRVGMKRDLAIRALRMAIAFRSPTRGCIFHSDRGSQGGFNRSSQHLDLARRSAVRPGLLPVIVDEDDHVLCRRSSSAIARYALALRRISLA